MTTWWQLTWCDCLSGGGTLLIHTPGTCLPSALAVVEEQKFDIFLLLHTIWTLIGVCIAAACIIQHFAEHIGFPIMQNWDCAKGLQPGGQHHSTASACTSTRCCEGQPIMPAFMGPYVTFYRHPHGALELLITQEIGTGIGETIPPT